MNFKYKINGKDEDNYSDIKYLAEGLQELDNKLLDFGHELDMTIDVEIIENVVDACI